MNLKEIIIKDLSNAIKKKGQINNLRLILGEIQRLPDKEPDNNDVIKVLKKLNKSEKEMQKFMNSETSELTELIESYLPKEKEYFNGNK